MKTKLSDIKITAAFKRTRPNHEKLLRCMSYYEKNGKLDRDIVITKDNILVDGYVGYLTLINQGVKRWKCVRDDSYQWYVQGKHKSSKKIYTWKLPDWLVIDDLPRISKGKTYWIKTTRGEAAVKVTKTFISNKPPVEFEISDFTLA